MAFFVKLLGERSLRLKVDVGQTLTIGRSPDSDLALEKDKLVSRSHCQLEGTTSGLVVRDLGSRNGTKLNGQRFEGEVHARAGDHITVGEAHLLVERKARERRRSTKHDRNEARRELPSLPGFEVVRELGESSTGRVYKAISEKDRSEVALKVLHSEATETLTKRFLRGAEILERLDHPNIVRVHEVRAHDDACFFTMELLDGVTLARMTEKETLGAREALSIGVQAARALKLVHNEGIIHRDIAPKHIMILHGAVVKLIGFDFVKDVEDEDATQLTQLGEIVGELTYSSPEQARDPRNVDHRTDLYALGAVLFHAVTGRPPFEGRHMEVFRKVLSEPAPRLRALVPTVTEALDAIVARLLEKDPVARFQSGAEVEQALDDALLEACRLEPDDPPQPTSDVMSTHDEGNEPPPGTRAFGGGFSGVELLEIMQFLELHEKEGRMVVRAPARSGELWLRRGIIVAARSGEQEGEPAARALLEAPEGTFEFHTLMPGDSIPGMSRALALQPASLALDVMRLRDEEARRK